MTSSLPIIAINVTCEQEDCPEFRIVKDCDLGFLEDEVFCGGCTVPTQKNVTYSDGSTGIYRAEPEILPPPLWPDAMPTEPDVE